MQSLATKLKSDGCDVLAVLMEYVNSKVPWACMPFAGGSKGINYVILKPHPKEMVGLVLKTMALKASMPPSKFAELFNPKQELTMGMMVDLLTKVGVEFPVCDINPVDHNFQPTTKFIVRYNGTVTLDYAEPDFFDKLDPVLDHIIQHDGLSGFSSPSLDEPSSD